LINGDTKLMRQVLYLTHNKEASILYIRIFRRRTGKTNAGYKRIFNEFFSAEIQLAIWIILENRNLSNRATALHILSDPSVC